MCGWNILAVFSIYPNKLSHTVNSKSRSIGRVMVASIISLYIATTINFSLNWEFRHEAVIVSFWLSDTGILHFISEQPMLGRSEVPGIGITVVVSTVIADSIMVCAILVANLNINLVLYILDLALLDGLGTTLARSSVCYPLSYFRIW